MKKIFFKLFVLMLLIIIASFLFDGTFGWITKSTTAAVDDNSLDVTEAESMGISDNTITFGNILTFSTSNKMLIPLTYNYQTDILVKPTFRKELNTATNLYDNVIDSLTNANSINYIEEEFYLKSSSGSRIGINLTNTHINGNELINAYGIDATNIKCAFKILIYQYINNEYELKLVYMPYAKYELIKTNNRYNLNINGNLESKYYFYNSGLNYITLNNNSDYVLQNNIYYLYKDNGKFYFTYASSEIDKFKIIIYLDGFDRECNNYFNYNDEYDNVFTNLEFTFDFCMD